MNVSSEIRKFVGKKISELQNGSPSSRANLAILRRGLGKEVDESIESWEFVYRDLPDDLVGNDDRISDAERAIYTTLTLFAMHQQGQEFSVHNERIKFGEAIASTIVPDKKNEIAVVRRFNSLITSDDMPELTNHLRRMIQLIKSSDKKICFDYEQFASDLFFFQSLDWRRNVKIAWGKQFYRHNGEKKEPKEA